MLIGQWCLLLCPSKSSHNHIDVETWNLIWSYVLSPRMEIYECWSIHGAQQISTGGNLQSRLRRFVHCWGATNRFFSGDSLRCSSLGFINEPIQLCRHLKCVVSQRSYSQRQDGLVAESALPYSRTCVTHSDVISPDVLLLLWSVFKVLQYRLFHWSWAVGNSIWSTA